MARQSKAGRESSLTRNLRHHKRFSKGYAAGERAAMFHDTAARVYRVAQCNITAAERRSRRGGCGVESRPIDSPSFLMGGGGDAKQTG